MRFDGYIMSRDTAAAKVTNGNIHILSENVCPLYLLNGGDLSVWLRSRAIDRHRAHSRLLIKALRLQHVDDLDAVLKVYAATITDTYWFRPDDSTLTYKDIRYTDDFLAKLALYGDYDTYNKAMQSDTSSTPELTNTGSFEKCWKLVGNEWWMYKRADHYQQFSEIFISRLGNQLGMNMVMYDKGYKCVKCRDFTHDASVNYEPVFSIVNENEDYEFVYMKLMQTAPHTVPDYVKMIFMDTLIRNPDRHTFNFGFLRDIDSGEIISLAPNFDNNMALISDGYPDNINNEDILIRQFAEFIRNNPSLKQYIPEVSRDTAETVIENVGMKVRKKYVSDFIMKRYGIIQRLIQ